VGVGASVGAIVGVGEARGTVAVGRGVGPGEPEPPPLQAASNVQNAGRTNRERSVMGIAYTG
jgi:hypothetical protein